MEDQTVRLHVVARCEEHGCSTECILRSTNEPEGEWTGGIGGYPLVEPSGSGCLDDGWRAPDGWQYSDELGWRCPAHDAQAMERR
jgi:hypothetical protein